MAASTKKPQSRVSDDMRLKREQVYGIYQALGPRRSINLLERTAPVRSSSISQTRTGPTQLTHLNH